MGIPLKDYPLVQAIHTTVSGRARYKVNGLYRSPTLKRYLESRLLKEQGIEQARANIYTGNVLVFFTSELTANGILWLIRDIVLDYITYTQQLFVKTTSTDTNQREDLHQEQTGAVVAIADKSTELEDFQHAISEAVLPKTPMEKQLVLVSGVVSGLILSTGLLHQFGLDERILLTIQRLHTPLFDRVMLGITALGEPVALLSICSSLLVGLFYRNRPVDATTLGVATFGAIGLNFLLKGVFRRTRPALWTWIIDANHYSFPSGHAMMSIVTYGFIGYSLAKEFPQYRRQIFVLTTLLIAAIGFSRLYLGVHWPTDVAAGYAVGLIWLVACILSVELWQKSRASLQAKSEPVKKQQNNQV